MKTSNRVLMAALGFCAACHDAGTSTPGPAKGVTVASVVVSSAAFSADSPIPVDYACDGPDQSPQLSWTAMPDSVKSIAIVVEDPDAPNGTFTHMLVWNMKPGTRQVGAGGSGGLGGGAFGTNDFNRAAYSGPCPPKGKVHHYRFNVYGLDTMLTLKPSDKRDALDHAMSAHVVAQGTLVGTYEH
jgi:Raf kinase inhibitor-like YbhB/YbcL family protein